MARCTCSRSTTMGFWEGPPMVGSLPCPRTGRSGRSPWPPGRSPCPAASPSAGMGSMSPTTRARRAAGRCCASGPADAISGPRPCGRSVGTGRRCLAGGSCGGRSMMNQGFRALQALRRPARRGVTGLCRVIPEAALGHHHRDPPVRLALVVVIGGPDLGHQLPQPFPLRPLGRAGPGPEPDVLDLHLDLRIVAQVEVPVGMAPRASLGGHHQVAVAILAEDERLGALLAAATASSREDQRGDAVPVIALLATGLAVAAHVLVPKQHRVLLAGMTGRRDATRVRGSSTAPRPPHRGERCWFPPARGTLSSAPSRSDRPGQLAERLSHLVQSFFRDPSLCYITA